MWLRYGIQLDCLINQVCIDASLSLSNMNNLVPNVMKTPSVSSSDDFIILVVAVPREVGFGFVFMLMLSFSKNFTVSTLT